MERTASRLSAYADGELGRWRSWQIARHLQRCEPCRRYVEQITGVARAMRGIAPGPVDAQIRRDALAAFSRRYTTS